jgi:hypothetical protein
VVDKGLCHTATKNPCLGSGGKVSLSLIQELTAALAHLRNLHPSRAICTACRHILNEQGRWQPLEAYFEEHSEKGCAQGLGPACTEHMTETTA